VIQYFFFRVLGIAGRGVHHALYLIYFAFGLELQQLTPLTNSMSRKKIIPCLALAPMAAIPAKSGYVRNERSAFRV
jgi:hypothetical protein